MLVKTEDIIFKINKDIVFKNIDIEHIVNDNIIIDDFTFQFERIYEDISSRSSFEFYSRPFFYIGDQIFVVYTEKCFSNENRDGIDFSSFFQNIHIVNFKSKKTYNVLINLFRDYDFYKLKLNYSGKVVHYLNLGFQEKYSFHFNIFNNFSFSDVILDRYIIILEFYNKSRQFKIQSSLDLPSIYQIESSSLKYNLFDIETGEKYIYNNIELINFLDSKKNNIK